MAKHPGDSQGGRAEAQYQGGTIFIFKWPCGAQRRKDYSKGPVAKRFGPEGAKIMASWWSKGGVNGMCPKCKTRSCSFPTSHFTAKLEKEGVIK